MKQGVLQSYHLFSHRDGRYVINIEGMSAYSIDDHTARVLANIDGQNTGVIVPLLTESLKRQEFEAAKKSRSETEKDVPIVTMCLFLTQSCNLKCIYCFGDEGKYGAGGMMDQKTAFQAVDWLIKQSGQIKKLHIVFFGGEPFLNFSLMRAVVEYTLKRVNENGKEVSFHTTTNATLLDDEIISFLKEHQVTVTVSFDGPKQVQDAQRPFANGRGSYDETLPKIKKLLAELPDSRGHAVIAGSTDPQHIKDSLHEIGFSRVSVVAATQSLFSEAKTNSGREIPNLLESLEEERERWGELIHNRDTEGLRRLMTESGLYPALIALLHHSKRQRACGAGRGLVAVSSTGYVYLCHRFVGKDEYRLGSIFGEVLDRKEYTKSQISGTGVCSSCFARYYCSGGCMHNNAASSCGSISTPDAGMCRLRCRELELAATITSKLQPEDMDFLLKQRIFPPKPCPLDF